MTATMMTAQQLLRVFRNVRMAPIGGGRAVHKPLLLLFWLARLQRGEPRLVAYADVEGPFRQLLIEFGSSNAPNTRQLPFWHLGNDADGSLWELQSETGIGLPTNSGSAPSARWMRENRIRAGLTVPVDALLRNNPPLRASLARLLLTDNFPETLQTEIAAQVGLDLDTDTGPDAGADDDQSTNDRDNQRRRRRDPGFRERVLRAYEYRCCVCGYDLRIGNVTAGLEAAHIQWFTAGGPDLETNGLAMCALHHKLLDLGAFTVEPVQLTIRFSQNIQVNEATRASLLSYHGAGLIEPQSEEYRPSPKYLDWHAHWVFKKPARG